MKIGVVISMYDEYEIVQSTINNILNYNVDTVIIVVESNENKTNELYGCYTHINLKNVYEFYSKLNLTDFKYRWMSHSLSRNFSIGFKTLYDLNVNFDIVIGLLGDTHIEDFKFIRYIYNSMFFTDKYIACLQPIGQRLHSRLDLPEKNLYFEDNIETDESTVVSPVFFVIRGDIATENKICSEIINTNELTFEQTLGDNLKYYILNFNKHKLLLNKIKTYCYSFLYTGITFHAISGAPGRSSYEKY